MLPSPTPIARGATFNVIMIVGISQEEFKTLHNTSTPMLPLNAATNLTLLDVIFTIVVLQIIFMAGSSIHERLSYCKSQEPLSIPRQGNPLSDLRSARKAEIFEPISPQHLTSSKRLSAKERYGKDNQNDHNVITSK